MRGTFNTNRKRKMTGESTGKLEKILWPHYKRISFLNSSGQVTPASPVAVTSEKDDDDEIEMMEVSQPVPVPPVKKKVVSSWTMAEEDKVIDFYQSNEELWNHRLPTYKSAAKSQLTDEYKFTRKYHEHF